MGVREKSVKSGSQLSQEVKEVRQAGVENKFINYGVTETA